MNIHELLKQMTLEEKLAQMTQIPPHFFLELSKTEVFGERRNIRFTRTEMMNIGSILGVHDAREMIQIQTMILEESRLKIPALFMADVIHGYQTIFPIPLAQASSFNDELVEEASHVSALEAAISGIHITFSPMVDLSRDARWGRVMEGYGEDPYLSSNMAASAVKGYQKGDPKSDTYVGACFKHFAGYGASEAGRDYNTVDMSYERFYNLYSKPYEAAINAKAVMTMLAFNTWNGIPSTIHQELIQNILVQDMGFEGVIISDYDALAQTIDHGASKDEAHACEQGLNAGLMIEMGTNNFINYGRNAVENNHVKEEVIDYAVLKILSLKEKLGLFENPFKGASVQREKEIVMNENHLQKALKSAEESIVLLKNNQILPLQKGLRIGLSGDYASTRSMLGSWHWKGQESEVQTYEEVFKKLGYKVVLINQESLEQLNEVDVILHMTGEPSKDTGESRSKVNIECPKKDAEWIEKVHQKKKKIISIVHSGRPLVLDSILESDGILYAWYLGTMHTEAVINIILGNASPSAKLPMSIPRHVGQYPMSYHDFTTGRPFNKDYPEYTTKYIDVDLTPEYSFGYGLTYQSLEYFVEIPSHLNIKEETLNLKIKIKNPSSMPVKDVIQLYYRLQPSQPVMGSKRLIRYQKILLNGYETKAIKWQISPLELLPLDEHKNIHPKDGWLTLWLGFSSHDLTPFKIEWSQA
jgi:beta-glucosidase